MEVTKKQEARMDDRNQSNTHVVKSYLTVKDFAKKHRAFTENSLRWMIFNRSTNGFDSCFRKVGKKRIVIDEAAFFEKIENSVMEA